MQDQRTYDKPTCFLISKTYIFVYDRLALGAICLTPHASLHLPESDYSNGCR
jgi:hypothetical protein